MMNDAEMFDLLAKKADNIKLKMNPSDVREIAYRFWELSNFAIHVKHGKWETNKDVDGVYGICSVCFMDADFSRTGKAFNFCPNCGARMDG